MYDYQIAVLRDRLDSHTEYLKRIAIALEALAAATAPAVDALAEAQETTGSYWTPNDPHGLGTRA